MAGIFTSLAFWYSTEVGLYTLGAIGLFLMIYSLQRRIQLHLRPLPLVGYCFGLILGFLPVATYFLTPRCFGRCYLEFVHSVQIPDCTWGREFPSLSETLSILSEEGWQAFFLSEGFRWYLPICVFMLTAAYLTYLRLCRTNVPPDDAMKLLLLLLGGIAYFRTALGRSDGGHLNYGATFLWFLCLFPLDRGISGIFNKLFGGEIGGRSPYSSPLC